MVAEAVGAPARNPAGVPVSRDRDRAEGLLESSQ